MGCKVIGVDEEAASVLIEGRERIEADLIVGADGKSSLTCFESAFLYRVISIKTFGQLEVKER